MQVLNLKNILNIKRSPRYMITMFIVESNAKYSVQSCWPNDSCSQGAFMGVRIVIWDTDREEPITKISSPVTWISKYLIDLKIYLLFRNVLKLIFFLEQFWKTRFRDMSSHKKSTPLSEAEVFYIWFNIFEW